MVNINELICSINWVLITQIVSTMVLGYSFIMFREFEDESARNNWTKPFKFWKWNFSVHWLNTGTGWADKWEFDDNDELIPIVEDKTFKIKIWKWVIIDKKYYKWWYFGVTPEHKEKFPYSSTILVPLTDGEHTFQKMQLNSIFGAFFVWNWIAGVSMVIGIYTFTFMKEKFFKKIH